MGNKHIYLGLIILVIFAFFLRTCLLGAVPPGLTNDEADIGHDAYSILLTGKDQWGKVLPLTSFKGFGDYRLPLYTYLVVPSIHFFGLNVLGIRLPSAIFGVLSVLLIFFVSKKLFRNSGLNEDAIGLSSAFILAVSPWSIGLSRVGIESNVAIAILLLALLSFLHSFKRGWLIIVSFVLFASSIYAYTSYSLYAPLVMLFSLFLFKKELLKHKKMVILGVTFFVCFVVPLFIFKSTAGVRASQISFINSQDNVGLLANLNDRRGSCTEKFPSIACKVTENKQVVFLNTFVRNYLNHFSPGLLYLNGTSTQFSMLPERSLLYTIEFIFLLSGVFFFVANKNKNLFYILILLLLSPVPDSLTGNGHYSRASSMMPFLFMIEGVGFVYLWKSFSKKPYYVFLSSMTLICVIMLYSLFSFLLSYFSYFPKYHSMFSQYGYETWAKKLSQKKDSYDKIFLSKYGNDTKQYIYYLLYTKYSPSEFQQKKDVSFSQEVGDWVSVDRIGNLFFVDRIPSEKDLVKISNKKVLLVSHPTEFPEDFILDKTEEIKDKNGNGVFAFVNLNFLLEYYDSHKTVNTNN